MKTVAFFATSGDSFVRPIIAALEEDHECDLFHGQNIEQLLQADLIWCDWADQMAVQISAVTDRPMAVRFHSYELFTDWPGQIDWSKVRHLIFVAEHVQKAANEKWPQLAEVPQSVIPNANPLPGHVPAKTWGGRVACVGTVTHKKGPGRMVEAFQAIHALGAGFTFHVAGKLADPRYETLFEDAIHGGLPLTLYGHVDDMAAWWTDKDIILNASPWEGQACAVMEGTAAGLKPLVAPWRGARTVYPRRWVWSSVTQAAGLANHTRHLATTQPEHYAALRQEDLDEIRERFPFEATMDRIRAIVDGIDTTRTLTTEVIEVRGPRVAAAMIVKNEARGLKKCLRSIREVVDEVYLFDTGSTDGTRKIAVREGAKLYTDDVPRSVKGRIHFGDARNVIINKVPPEFEWILIIDGDEVLMDRGDLFGALEVQDHDALGVRVVSVGDGGVGADEIQPRLFRRGKIRYVYPVHNQPVGWERQLITTAVIRAHYEGQRGEKARRSIPILEDQAEIDGANPRWSKLLTRTYLMLAGAENDEGALRKALVWSRRCRDLAAGDPRHAGNWPRLVRLTAQLAGAEAAEKILTEGLALFPDLADLRYEQLVLTAFAWHDAARKAREKYPFLGQGTLGLVDQLPQAAKLLRMPVEFSQEGR